MTTMQKRKWKPDLKERLRLSLGILKIAKQRDAPFDTVWYCDGWLSVANTKRPPHTERRLLRWWEARDLVDGEKKPIQKEKHVKTLAVRKVRPAR